MKSAYTLPEIPLSRTAIETCEGHIMRELYKLGTVSEAERAFAPLGRYIWTGRASADFLKRLIYAKPFMIARRLHKGGSDDEVVNRICQYIGYRRQA